VLMDMKILCCGTMGAPAYLLTGSLTVMLALQTYWSNEIGVQ